MMNSRSVIVLAVCAVLFLVAMPRGLGGRRGAYVLFFGSDDAKGTTALADTDKDSMEQIWSNCRLHLPGLKSAVRALDFLILVCISNDSTWLLRGDMVETLAFLIPEMKRSAIECLVKQILLPISAEGGPRNMYTMHLLRMLQQHPLSRRHLEDQSIHKTSLASAPSPSLALRSHSRIQTPGKEPAPASSPAPAANSHSELKPNALVPSLPLREPPLPEDDIKDFSPTPLTDDYVEPEVVHQAPPLPEQKSNSIHTIIVAVVVTAIATFALAAFCFCCCNRFVGRNYQTVNSKKDESPLLSLSLSDFSGSSQKSFGLGNTLHEDKLGFSSFKVDPGRSDQVVYFGSSVEGYSEASRSNEPTNAHGNPSAPAVPPPPSLNPLPGKTSSPPPAPPPPLPKAKPAPPPPPPPPKGGPPPKGPLPPQAGSSSFSIPQPPPNRSAKTNDDADGSKAKLKPFFWDKVMAQPDQSMVWHQIKSGSFQFNEEMIETLFGYNAADKRRNDAKMDLGSDSTSHCIRILDPKKSQNLAISLKAQNVKVEEVCDALMEGNELPVELLQTLLRMAPTTDEELKLRLFNDDSIFLGPAEQFLKAIVNIPFAFKRMDALLFMSCLQEESSSLKESLFTLEEACKELRNSRLFLKLLEAVLKTGNRMNDGTYRGGAQAFKLDTLLKLSDVKGADGKTTLLHFVVQEIIRSEGRRAVRVAREKSSTSKIAISSLKSEDFPEDIPEGSEDLYRNLGLKVVSSLHGELENVKKVAGLDADTLTSSVASLGNRLVKAKEFVNTDIRNLEEVSGFHDSLKAFVEHAEADITCLLEEEKRIRLLVKNTTDYFHGNAGRDEGLRVFVIVRDFLGILDKVCKEVREAPKLVTKTLIHKENQILQPMPEPRQLLFPAIKDRRMYDSSSEDEES